MYKPSHTTSRQDAPGTSLWFQATRLTILALATAGLTLGCRDAGAPEPVYLPTDPVLAPGGPTFAAPENVTALPASVTQIDINWGTNTTRETGFEIHRSIGGAPGSFSLHTTVGANVATYSDPGLTPGSVYCYQLRAVRVTNTGTTSSEFSNTACATAAPIPIVGFASVTAGGAHSCALTSAGAAFCWGRGESGQLGVPVPPSTCMTESGLFPCSMVPVPVNGGISFTQLAGGSSHTCGLTSAGVAWCWGSNAEGQLGDNTTTNRDAPVPVATGLTFVSIDAGASHTCALESNGAAWCWGRNNRGQLGNGGTTNSPVPVAVSGGLSFQQITAGGFINGYTCGLTSGNAHCWGDNERGQLGIGAADLVAHSLPLAVSGGLTFTALTAGLGRHTCGLTPSGAAWCWGENTYGALGIRGRRDSSIPAAVAGNLSFIQVVAGGFIGHTCARLGTGTAYCWGENERGQVGDGTTTDRWIPVTVDGGLVFGSVDAGLRHSCGYANGTVYCWGANGAGQLGNNSNAQSNVPLKVFGQP